MDLHDQHRADHERQLPPSIPTAAWLLAAIVAHLVLLDAAVETFLSASPLRWWLTPAFVACAAASAWFWRPGGAALARFGPASAAAAPLVALLAGLAASAWLPGGQDSGVRMLLQPPSRVLAAAVALAALAASSVTVRRAAFLPAGARITTRVALALLGGYALAALALGIVRDTPFAQLFNGGAA